MGHLGKDWTLLLIPDRFYWPKMEDNVTYFVTKICCCVKRKKPHIVPVAAMQSFSSAGPLEVIGLDFLHLDTCSGGYQYLLVLINRFLKFLQVYQTTNKSAKTTAGWLYNHFMLRYGLPGKIIHSQRREFDSKLFFQLSKICGIKWVRATPYRPQTNGQIKRINQTILPMFKTLTEHLKTQWKKTCQQIIPCIQLYERLINCLFPIWSLVWSCSLFTSWCNLTSMSRHHSVTVTVKLYWTLERSNGRSLPTCFSTF